VCVRVKKEMAVCSCYLVRQLGPSYQVGGCIGHFSSFALGDRLEGLLIAFVFS
jgi:hypothetical protein